MGERRTADGMLPAEFRSWIQWRALERGDDHPPPLVLFFEHDPPPGLLESGLYVNFDDFRDARREVGMRDEPLANLFHTLVLFFAQTDPRLQHQAERQLRYNPDNQASWNRQAWTYDYYILTQVLLPYAPNHVEAEYKIPGVGKVGRQVLRAILFEDMPIDDKLKEERDRFPH